LQVVGWAVVGGLVGLLADRAWMQRRRPWGTVALGAIAAFGLVGVHAGLGLWLEQHDAAALRLLWPGLAMTALLVAGVAGGLEVLRHFLEHPLPPPRRREWRARRPVRPEEPERAPLPMPAQLPEWQPAEESDGLIMLELD
jgi:hypothetical protein